ncbi:type II toxin-antitoxin system VapC family toxin [Geobacter argillaceus]|uniref:Putative nucleic acid-binding protein n=1 Tax=Geobacter argillaceus TaxID=345631 RepID=A0A562VM60_9BACT|nr:type II toxin-antitoxin system VapC family toxin [Geobacter argillaceus]TWJ18975.1 putative nucleic acid-binding protein [Geobacter argillaceus]
MITSKVYVPDASVILKWVFDIPEEAGRDAALMLLDSWVAGECEFVLPSLWLYEVGNIIGRNIPGKAAEVMELLIEYRITEAPVNSAIVSRTLAIMSKCKVTFYDAVYHAIALERRGTLVTADAAYMKKAGKHGNAVLLSDLGR